MKNEKIEKYHYEEIVLILLILASDLSKYNEDDLELFSEDIEGRIDILFSKEELVSFDKRYGFKYEIILLMEELKLNVINQYQSNWINNLKISTHENDLIRNYSMKILKELQISYVEPNKFAESHLNIEW